MMEYWNIGKTRTWNFGMMGQRKARLGAWKTGRIEWCHSMVVPFFFLSILPLFQHSIIPVFSGYLYL
jgi:hypothetical protein